MPPAASSFSASVASIASSSFALVALSASLSMLAGCAYKKEQAATANGAERQLDFLGVSNADLGTVPIGATRTITVARFPGGTTTCHPLGIKTRSETINEDDDGIHVLGGGHPNLPSDTCDGIPAEAVDLDSAECDDGACTITHDSRDDRVVLSITAKEAASHIRLNVRLKAKSDGAIHSDWIAVSFAKAARIALTTSTEDRTMLTMPLLPKARIMLPVATVVDADSKPMSLDADALVRSIEGDAVEDHSDSYSISARAPGRAKVRWDVAGVISRTLDLEVVDPALVARVVVHPARTEASLSLSDGSDLDTPPPTAAADAELSTVELASAKYVWVTYPTHLLLKDGRSAIGPIDDVTITPAGLAGKAHADEIIPSEFSIDEAPVAGNGAITIRVGNVSTTFPLVIDAPDRRRHGT